MTSRELVLSTLEFRNTEGRVPRDLWTLPWAGQHYPEKLQKILTDYEPDFGGPVVKLSQPMVKKSGDPYAVGTSIDAWGCEFTNIHRGIIGEVKTPLVQDDDWEDVDNVHIPEELLSFDVDAVNESCRNSDKFMGCGACPRPFEQLQFIRGTVNLYMDLMDPPRKMMEFIEKMHDFYCRLLTKWAQTDVDCLNMMDDWGSQQSLLINPTIWEEIFMPMYRDYIDIAHKHGKKMFMHSDGNILTIIPKLIDIGLDAVNSQIFCMGVENLAQFKGKITFWGEIDRQHLLPNGTQEDIDRAVESVYNTLWQDGGCIAQCEFGAGANPDNVYRVYEHWNQLR